jgi:hypothetical protein
MEATTLAKKINTFLLEICDQYTVWDYLLSQTYSVFSEIKKTNCASYSIPFTPKKIPWLFCMWQRTRQLTKLLPCSKILLEKLTVSQLANIFLLFYGTWRFTTLCITRLKLMILSWILHWAALAWTDVSEKVPSPSSGFLKYMFDIIMKDFQKTVLFQY